ncbi:MAG TPA: sulfatase-like hydrolase/transferase [Thermoanaerobaculia bacterium]|nr:sulfatase-like hydrolase/transferase [Thermoanaerobaculia bacterium]
MSPRSGFLALVFATGLLVTAGAATLLPAAAPGAPPPSLLLLTLDTTRADALGCYGAARPTPALDALAARGVRFARALTASPLTLPAHASLLTGLDPPAHGVHDNGAAVLPADLPTLATALQGRGYATAAFVSSRVLDRRFGLGRGFSVYDDRMAAEQIGEYGYPERDARQVTAAALGWLGRRPAGKPAFLWVHFYDPHAPYEAPGTVAGRGPSTARAAYDAEVAFMDREIGRLLAALPSGERWLVAAVGDHGEGLGEHGERGHGLFLYRASLEVPLLLAGPGVPAGRVVGETVATRRLAPTLLRLLGAPASKSWGTPLPGFGPAAAKPETVYSETYLPATAYGWSALTALSDARWRLIAAPKPELYDYVADPAERRNRISESRQEARRLRDELVVRAKTGRRETPRAAEDGELAAALRSLGYMSGASGGVRSGGGIDPKDGVAMLGELDRAKQLLRTGRAREAAGLLADLVRRSPGNVPFLTQLGAAQLQSGQGEAALATYRKAAEANPGLDLLHVNLAEALRALGRREEARKEYELALKLNPRSAGAWLRLAEIAEAGGQEGEARRVLRRAVAAGTESASVLTRLAVLEAAAGDRGAAERAARQATEVAPGWAPAWLELGKILVGRGERVEGKRSLEQAVAMAPGSPVAQEARRLLAGLRD